MSYNCYISLTLDEAFLIEISVELLHHLDLFGEIKGTHFETLVYLHVSYSLLSLHIMS